MTALKREVEELETIINDLKDQVTRMGCKHEEWMDRHREDIDWQKEECILLLDYSNMMPFIFPFRHLAIWPYLALINSCSV